ncbi:acyl-CoA dehydrogenase family protein [Pseudomonas sp. RA_15y_Pfl2_54]|uniref:acyl-CoA dehydrogenase family protein n=1 Tax=Pseudomonas sp. RA_15y_Pfl2_54 TaxID=3088704 RepID=UPI0030DD4221
MDWMAHLSLEHHEACARARTLLDNWKSRAAETEQARCISQQTMSELLAEGLMQLIVPERYGGWQCDWPTLVETSRIAARVCPSTAWMIGLVGSHAAIVGRLSSDCQAQVFADGLGQVIATASVSKDVSILKVEGGFRISGTWRFSSGVDHADWVIVSAKSLRDTSLNPVLLFTLRIGEVQIEDVWHVTGMCGTGSKDLRLDDVFVADAWVTPQSECFGAAPAGARRNPDGYLFDVEVIPYLGSLHIGPVLGCAEGAFDECVAALRNREGSKDGAAAKARPTLLERVAESAAQLSCARHLYHAICFLLHSAGMAGRSLSVQELLTLKRDRAYLVRLCVQAIQRLVQQMGTAVIFQASPVQRHWRDLQVMASHLDVNWESAMLAYGDFAMDHHPCDPAMKG